jgi:tRNA(Arg) A34 adenosine deaminase TadA
MCLAAIYWARIDRIYYAATQTDAAAAGFDDALFYEELALPPHVRRVPMTRLLADEATPPFDAWRALPNRVSY